MIISHDLCVRHVFCSILVECNPLLGYLEMIRSRQNNHCNGFIGLHHNSDSTHKMGNSSRSINMLSVVITICLIIPETKCVPNTKTEPICGNGAEL